jgi:hypothetical protein
MRLGDYQERVLNRVRAGAYVPFRWAPLELSPDLTIFVAEDALLIEDADAFILAQEDLKDAGFPPLKGEVIPFRASVTAQTAQAICDHLGVLLPTDRILDQLEQVAVIRNKPSLQPADAKKRREELLSPYMDDVASMLLHSLEVDAAAGPGLMLNPGKHWFINYLLSIRAKESAFNKGWWAEDAVYTSWRTHKKLWQTGEYDYIPGKECPHNFKHVDYSQVFQPMRGECLLRGSQTALAPLLEDPKISSILTYYQPMPWRHPWL